MSAADRAEADIRALLDEASAALHNGDWPRYERLWAHERWISVIHPAENEWLTGWDAIGPAYHALLSGDVRPNPERRNLRIRVAPSSDMGWATVEAMVVRDGGPVRLWQTFVFERGQDGWRIVHGHVSVPTE